MEERTMISMKPILFNTEMVKALLDGHKTVTRRVIKPQPEGRPIPMPSDSSWPGYFAINGTNKVIKPPYRTGDILYVRETWDNEPVSPGGHTRLSGVYYYKADGDLRPEEWRGNWRPSIHMPKEAARLFLRVMDVRVERLQSITPEQIDAEGYKEWAYSATTGELLPSSPTWLKIAWNRTVKRSELPVYGWEANPWVWVIEFKRISGEEAKRRPK